jgi:hypothetical protein
MTETDPITNQRCTPMSHTSLGLRKQPKKTRHTKSMADSKNQLNCQGNRTSRIQCNTFFSGCKSHTENPQVSWMHQLRIWFMGLNRIQWDLPSGKLT